MPSRIQFDNFIENYDMKQISTTPKKYYGKPYKTDIKKIISFYNKKTDDARLPFILLFLKALKSLKI